MKRAVLVVGHQNQANKPVILHHTGVVECGEFQYKGRYKKRFKEIYQKIVLLGAAKERKGVIDVSHCGYWNATRIYHEYVVARWVKSVSAGRLEKFAIETEVFLLLEEVRAEFKRAVGFKWRKITKNTDPYDSEWPRNAWEIL